MQIVVEAARTVRRVIAWPDIGEPDTVQLLVRANVELLRAGCRDVLPELTNQLERLLELRVQGRRGGWGWGLKSAWDAFGDGVVNPATTIYSYTTAAAGLAFLDGYAVTRDTRHLDAADRAAQSLLTDTCCWTRGPYRSVWYDDQPHDQTPDRQVHNVNALTLGLLARLDGISTTPRFRAERRAMAAHLIDDQGQGYTQTSYDETPVSASNWRYSSAPTARPNDLIHETFIVDGLLTHGTRAAVKAARRSATGIARCHFDDLGAPRDGTYTRGSMGWGPAAALFTLVRIRRMRSVTNRIAGHIVDSVGESGSSFAPADRVRAQAWYMLALSRYARGRTRRARS